ncbi:MAG: DUF5034 domain-containing protein [bacterium]|nr:DUF5034 domain-containing protein [bacterium]
MKHIIQITLLMLIFCSCRKYTPSVYEVVGIELGNCDNSDIRPIEVITDSVPMKAYAIKITLTQEMRKKSNDPESESGTINEDRLNSFNIFSLNNFDSSHPARASLNTYFLTALGASATIESLVSKGEIGGGIRHNNDAWTTEEFLYLMTPPSAAGNQSFVVNIGLSDGRNLSDTIKVKLY